MFRSFSGRLAALDRIARGVVGLGLILWGALSGASTWAVVVAIVVGVSLLLESAISFCPFARLLPWNRGAK